LKSLKILRCNKNITQEEFAKSLGVTVQTVSHWENGKTIPTKRIMDKISYIYQVPIEWIMANDPLSKPIIKENKYYE
jgi:transcriptional regulator with XRE-family HTH domain